MSRALYGNLDLVLNQILNVRLQSLGSDPSALESQVYYNSTAKEIRFHNGTAWIALGPAGAGGPPTGGATGDLTGSYPSPQIAANVIVDADINTGAAIQQSKIQNLTTDLAAKLASATAATTYLPLAAPTLTSGDLTLTRDPSSALHAATKQYVDLTSQGLDYKASVKVATTANITLSAAQTIDGVSVVVGDRVLVKDQSTASGNGIYTVAAGAWTRTTDADANGEISDGSLVPVEQGTASGDSLWICTATGATPWVPGTSTSTWTRYGSVTAASAGAGLILNGSALDVVSANADMTVGADSVTINSAPKWSTARTLTLSGDLTGNVAFDGSAAISLAATLAAGAGGKRYAVALSTASPQTVTHNLNTKDVVVSVYNTNSPYEEILVEVEHTTVNSVTLKHVPALPAGYRAVVLG